VFLKSYPLSLRLVRKVRSTKFSRHHLTSIRLHTVANSDARQYVPELGHHSHRDQTARQTSKEEIGTEFQASSPLCSRYRSHQQRIFSVGRRGTETYVTNDPQPALVYLHTVFCYGIYPSLQLFILHSTRYDGQFRRQRRRQRFPCYGRLPIYRYINCYQRHNASTYTSSPPAPIWSAPIQ
jgi:hypothetical protein